MKVEGDGQDKPVLSLEGRRREGREQLSIKSEMDMCYPNSMGEMGEGKGIRCWAGQVSVIARV